MTYIEKLAEKIGVKEAVRAAFEGCPGNHFEGGRKPGLGGCVNGGCGNCWLGEMKEGGKDERV